MKKEMCCIVCPMSCHIEVAMDDEGSILHVTGNSCPRGEAYARSEAVDPQRVVTTTVRIKNAKVPLLPVITSHAVSKSKMFAIIQECQRIEVEAPIDMNTIIIENIADSGADLVASRTMEKKS